MRRIAGTPSRLIPITIVLLGCSAGRGGPSQRPSTELPSQWTTPQCFIADTTAPTPDTLYVIGAAPRTDGTLPQSFGCAADHHVMAESPEAPVVMSMQMPTGADLRDVLDVGLSGRRPDVVVTRETDVIAYAARRTEYLTQSLPWSTTYVVITAPTSPGFLEEDPGLDSVTASHSRGMPSAAERDLLARDAVAADARRATEPFPWLTDTSCVEAIAGPGSAAAPVIAYAAADATARQLAERLLSLSGARPRREWLSAVLGDRQRLSSTTLRVAAVPVDSIANALATGRAIAAVMPIARDPLAHCGTQDDARAPAGAVPLIDTRAHVIVRRGSGAVFFVAPDGSLRFVRRRLR